MVWIVDGLRWRLASLYGYKKEDVISDQIQATELKDSLHNDAPASKEL